MKREYNMNYTVEAYGTVSFEGDEISQKAIDYLTDFKKFVEKQGANVYFVAPIDYRFCYM